MSDEDEPGPSSEDARQDRELRRSRRRDQAQDRRIQESRDADARQDTAIARGARADERQDASLARLESAIQVDRGGLPGAAVQPGVEQRLKIAVPTGSSVLTLGGAGSSDTIGYSGFSVGVDGNVAVEAGGQVYVSSTGSSTIQTGDRMTLLSAGTYSVGSQSGVSVQTPGSVYVTAGGPPATIPEFSVRHPAEGGIPTPDVDPATPADATENVLEGYQLAWSAYDLFDIKNTVSHITHGVKAGEGVAHAVAHGAHTSGVMTAAPQMADLMRRGYNAGKQAYSSATEWMDGGGHHPPGGHGEADASGSAEGHEAPGGSGGGGGGGGGGGSFVGPPKVKVFGADGVYITTPSNVYARASFGVNIYGMMNTSMKAGLVAEVKSIGVTNITGIVSGITKSWGAQIVYGHKLLALEGHNVTHLKGKVKLAMEGADVSLDAGSKLAVHSKGPTTFDSDGKYEQTVKADMTLSSTAKALVHGDSSARMTSGSKGEVDVEGVRMTVTTSAVEAVNGSFKMRVGKSTARLGTSSNFVATYQGKVMLKGTLVKIG